MISSDAAIFFELLVVYLPAVEGPVIAEATLSLRSPSPTFSAPFVKSSSAISLRSISEKPSPVKVELHAYASFVPKPSFEI